MIRAEAGIPLAQVGALAATDVDNLLFATAETGGADLGAVAAAQTAFRHRLPMGVIKPSEQLCLEIPRGQMTMLRCRGCIDFSAGGCGHPRGRILQRQPLVQALTGCGAGGNQVALIRFVQGEIKAITGLGTIAGMGAKTGVAGVGAVYGDQQ